MAEREDRSQRLTSAGAWLAAARRRAQVTQEELATAASTSPQSISNYERGVASVPDDKAAMLAQALGLGEIETRRGLGLYVPADAADAPPLPVNVEGTIRRDPHLIPEARKHLLNQYALLRRLGDPSPLQEVKEDLLKLPHAARKRPPRKPRP